MPHRYVSKPCKECGVTKSISKYYQLCDMCRSNESGKVNPGIQKLCLYGLLKGGPKREAAD